MKSSILHIIKHTDGERPPCPPVLSPISFLIAFQLNFFLTIILYSLFYSLNLWSSKHFFTHVLLSENIGE